jgi:hypothetical protein
MNLAERTRQPEAAPEGLAYQIHRAAWKAPAGWKTPHWLEAEPHPACLPMSKDRMHWCLHAIGWSLQELAWRVHTHESSIRQMGRGKRPIPDVLAIWLEHLTTAMLALPAVPDGWREDTRGRPD